MRQKPLLREYFDSSPTKRPDKSYNTIMQISDASKLFHDRMRRLSEQDGLPSSYRMLIFHLAHMKTGVTQLELVKATHLKAPTVSITLQKMERDGIITRKSNEMDLRQTFVYLTEKGKAIDEKIKVMHSEGTKAALHGLSDSEIETLSVLLNRVIDNLLCER